MTLGFSRAAQSLAPGPPGPLQSVHRPEGGRAGDVHTPGPTVQPSAGGTCEPSVHRPSGEEGVTGLRGAEGAAHTLQEEF